MAKGSECPSCKQATFHNTGRHQECSNCGYLGFLLDKLAPEIQLGMGPTCPICKEKNLEVVIMIETCCQLFWCSSCKFLGLKPADERTVSMGSSTPF